VAHTDEEERARPGAEQDALQEHEPGAHRQAAGAPIGILTVVS